MAEVAGLTTEQMGSVPGAASAEQRASSQAAFAMRPAQWNTGPSGHSSEKETEGQTVSY